MDHGPIVIQAVVPVRDDDTADTLAARILREEHRIYPQALQYLAEGRLRIEGRRVLVDPPSPGSGALHNPSVKF
jgi:phosphoribosylglycinamide formyltransferase-1